MNHAAFVESAHAVFPGSTAIHSETYEAARDRMMGWIKSLVEILPDSITRFCIACEAAHLATVHAEVDEMHRGWARQLIRTELAPGLDRLHAACPPLAADFPSTDPATWLRKPTVCTGLKF